MIKPVKIRGDRIDGEAVITVVSGQRYKYGSVLKHVVRHSPDGFEWGYMGSGPSDLALSILYLFYGKDFAEKNYQKFKQDVIANLDRDEFVLNGEDIEKWKERIKDEQR